VGFSRTKRKGTHNIITNNDETKLWLGENNLFYNNIKQIRLGKIDTHNTRTRDMSKFSPLDTAEKRVGEFISVITLYIIL